MDDLISHQRSPKTWDDLISTCIENSEFLPEEASDGAKRAERNSQVMRLRRRFLELAKETALARNREPDDSESLQLLDAAHDTADSIIYSYVGLPNTSDERALLSESDIRRRLSMTYHASPRFLVETIKKDGRLEVGRDDLEAGVKRYLDGNLKHPDIDRVLLYSLIDMEITAFIDEMTSKDLVSGKSPVEQTQVNLNAVWMKGRVAYVVLAAMLIAAGFAAEKIAPVTPDWIPVAILSIALIGFVFDTVATRRNLPAVRSQVKAAQDAVGGNIERMSSFYADIRTEGPLSLLYLRRELLRLKDHGVVWPVSIWALLDDIEKRGHIHV